ncbi:MAG: hypothetical protein PUG70_00850 [Lachnospiraceae bacterium]|nr:hypothetical protein [Lachnospiraceae bacterium]MDY5521647.1 hypothetical protein [Agathobacter sp.]
MRKRNARLIAGLMAVALVASTVVTQPSVASAAPTKTVTVKTQKQLNAALKDKTVTEVVIKTDKNVTLKIEDRKYSKISLTVSSPKATINNYGDFKKITVNDGKTFTDRGDGNNILVKDKNSLKLVAGKQSSDMDITVSKYAKNGKLTIVNNGDVDTINIKAANTVVVRGNAKKTQPTITVNAANVDLTTAMNANVVLNKSATLTVANGTELGSLKVNANADITVAEGASVAKVNVAKKASEVNLVADGSVGNVILDSKATLSVSGDTKKAIAITNNAEGASINSSVKTDVTLNADASVSLDKGAEGSSVKAGKESVTPTVDNKTDSSVTVTDSTGKDTTVESGKSETITPDTNTGDDTSSGGGSNNGGGSNSNGGGSNSNEGGSSSGGGSSSNGGGSSSNGGSGNTDGTGGTGGTGGPGSTGGSGSTEGGSTTGGDPNESSPESIKSLSGDFYIFEDSRIGTTGTEGTIETALSNGVVTLHPSLSLKPVNDKYLLPVRVYSEYMIDSYELIWNNEAGHVYAPCIQPYAFMGTYLEFHIVLDNNAADKIGAAFYMDYDGEGTKYSKSDLIKIDTSDINFLPADSEVDPVVTTPSAITGLDLLINDTYFNTSGASSVTKYEDDSDSECKYSIQATLNYVTDVPGFSDDYAKGYYLPLTISIPSGVNAGDVTLTPADNCVTRVGQCTIGNGNISFLVRSCKGHENPLQLVIDFDGEGTEWAPYTINIDESVIVLNVTEGAPADLHVVSELPEGVDLARADSVCRSLSTWYADGIVTINGDMQMDIINSNKNVQFFMNISKGDNVGVAIKTAYSTTYHMFETESTEVAVQGDVVWISKVIELNNSGELNPDSQASFTIYMLEAGPDGTYNLAKAYTINVVSEVTVMDPGYDYQ